MIVHDLATGLLHGTTVDEALAIFATAAAHSCFDDLVGALRTSGHVIDQ